MPFPLTLSQGVNFQSYNHLFWAPFKVFHNLSKSVSMHRTDKLTQFS